MSCRSKAREKISQNELLFRPVLNLTRRWNEIADGFIQRQAINPFSGRYSDSNRPRWVKGSCEYATPVGKTAERGEKARRYITKQIDILCHVIIVMGQIDCEGRFYTTFGELFERYTRISSNVVGLLLRARKRQLLDFPGEMLWQRRDDDVIITLDPNFSRSKL